MKKKMSLKFLWKPIILIISMYAGANAVLLIEKLRPSDFGFYKDLFSRESVIKKRDSYPIAKENRELTEEDLKAGRIAWKYFENNYQPNTGFVNSVNQYPGTTIWDLSSYLHGMLSSYEIGILDSLSMDTKIRKLLSSMALMPLYEDRLPNKVYNTQYIQMTNYQNLPSEGGVGWSSMDIGRFFSCATRIQRNYPQYATLVNKVINRWDVKSILGDATLHGVGFNFKDKRVSIVQEGKLGYEQYAAKGYASLGFDVSNSLNYTDFIKYVDVYNLEIGADIRESLQKHLAYNYVTSEPYILDGLEYGWDVNSRELAYRVYQAQKMRYEKENIITAVSESNIDTIPYFVYFSVYANGKKWSCVSESGDNAADFKSISTKAAFAWSIFYDDDYSMILRNSIKNLYDDDLGWYSGKYEKSGKINKAITANTNGIILEALRYKLKGPLVKLLPKDTTPTQTLVEDSIIN